MEVTADVSAAPAEVAELLEGPHLQRQVYLRTAQAAPEATEEPSPVLVYAASWWNAGAVGEYLRDTSKPIWTNLSQERTELYRDIRRVYHGECEALRGPLGRSGPFWGRDYVFWHNGAPLTAIHEVFSPALSRYLDADA